MRNIVHNALTGARTIMDKAMNTVAQGNQLSDDEALLRYTTLHRNNPVATQDFVVKNAPMGTNPMVAQHEYELAMETLLRERGFRK